MASTDVAQVAVEVVQSQTTATPRVAQVVVEVVREKKPVEAEGYKALVTVQ